MSKIVHVTAAMKYEYRFWALSLLSGCTFHLLAVLPNFLRSRCAVGGLAHLRRHKVEF